jgi:general secretion pathway protein C
MQLMKRTSKTGLALVPTVLIGALLLLCVGLAARLFWVLFAPIGPVGDWKPAIVSNRSLPQDRLAGFDPFFRLQAPQDAVAVTSLAVKLFGVRVDSASGRGSAIIATPDGVQSSFAVGDEVMPGVLLKQVAFDHVILERQGKAEQVFLDQSGAVPPSGTSTVQAAAPSPPTSAFQDAVAITPQMADGKVSGLAIAPKGDGSRFRSAGFENGDVIVAVNGVPVSDPTAMNVIGSGSPSISVDVERGGRRIPINAKIAP